MEIIILLFATTALFSIIGYGTFFNNIFLDKKNALNLGLIGFLGLFFLSSISYFTHFFLPHDFIHNIVLIIIGVTLFIYYKNIGNILIKRIYFYIILFLLIGIFIGKSHDDFGYYHLPNALHFSYNKLEFGLGNLNHGFKHHSSIFYLYSVFYLPVIKFYLFNIINFFFLLFSILYFVDKIDDDTKNYKVTKLTFIKLLFCILFISIFNRIGEYGTDITGQILAGVLIYLTIEAITKKIFKSNDIFLILILLAYLITIKTYFIVYILFPLLIFLLKISKIKNLKNLFFSKTFIFITFVGLMFISINISATGCVIYPIKSLCFPNIFEWGLSENNISYMSNWYEIWSKAGAGPDFRESDPLLYIDGFNWVENWVDKYFFNKVSDYLLSILFCMLVVFIIFYKNIKIKLSLNRNILYLLFIIFLLFGIWFYNFPSLRYGGYILILSILIIIFASIFNINNKQFTQIRKKLIITILLSFAVFITKNSIRIKKEFNYIAIENFKSFPLFYVKDVAYEEIYLNNEKIYKVKGMCWSTPSPCLRNINKTIKKSYGYKIYINK